MSVEYWRSSSAVNQIIVLRRGRNFFTSKWPAIVAAVQQYSQLSNADLNGRRAVLMHVVERMIDWEAHQRSNFTILIGQQLAAQKSRALQDLRSVIRHEQNDIAQQQRNATPRLPGGAVAAMPYATSTATAPMAIGGAGSSSRAIAGAGGSRAWGQSISPPDVGPGVSKYGVWPSNHSALQTETVNENDLETLSDTLDIHVHFTRNRYADSIATEGLQPGRARGIGLPEGGSDNYNYYTLTGSSRDTTKFVGAEAGPRNVVVLSRKHSLDAYRDMNYREGGARAVPGHTEPLGRDTVLGQNAISVVLPLDDQSAENLARLLSRTYGNGQISATRAAALLSQYLRTNITPLRF